VPNNLRSRLKKLEARRPAQRFTVWDWLASPEDAPPGWTLPPEWRALLAELKPGPRVDPIEEMIHRAENYRPTDEELAERLRQLEHKVQEARNDPTRNGNPRGPA
jgi:hypothetical protein